MVFATTDFKLLCLLVTSNLFYRMLRIPFTGFYSSQIIQMDYTFWKTIKPIRRVRGRKAPRQQKCLPEGWTDLVAHALPTNCQIVFTRHYVNKLQDISIQAICGSPDCSVKFNISIQHPQDKSTVLLDFETQGISNHSEKIERPLSGENRKLMGEYLQNKSVTETYYRRFNNPANAL